MLSRFDRRVVAESVLDFVRCCQEKFTCTLGGGAALAGAYLAHRTTGDIDLYLDDADDLRALVAALPDAASVVDGNVTVLRDAGYLVRARLETPQGGVEMDIVHDPVPDIEQPAPALDGVVGIGHAPEEDLDLARRKDAGIDPGVLAWLLSQFPTAPLPGMLKPLTPEQLAEFRKDLTERMRRISLG